MLILQIIGFTVLSILITMVFMIVYFGLLSRFTNWLILHYGERIRRLLRRPRLPNPINNISNSGDDTRPESDIIICYINCFENGYHLLKTWIGRISYSIRELTIRKDRGYHNDKCDKEYHAYNIQKLFHKPILNRSRRSINQSGKEPTRSYDW